MKDISLYFKKIISVLGQGEETSLVIKKEIESFVPGSKDRVSIKIKDNELFLNTSPVIKTEILIKKDQILKSINSKGVTIKDLR